MYTYGCRLVRTYDAHPRAQSVSMPAITLMSTLTLDVLQYPETEQNTWRNRMGQPPRLGCLAVHQGAKTHAIKMIKCTHMFYIEKST